MYFQNDIDTVMYMGVFSQMFLFRNFYKLTHVHQGIITTDSTIMCGFIKCFDGFAGILFFFSFFFLFCQENL